MFRVFSAVFLCFSRVFAGVERGKESLVFCVVFLGFYLNTKEWKIRVCEWITDRIANGKVDPYSREQRSDLQK